MCEKQVYVQVNREAEHDESVRSDAADFYRRLEQHDEQALLLWKQFREITVQEYKRIYQVTLTLMSSLTLITLTLITLTS